MKSLRNTALDLALCMTGASATVSGELTIATINNGHMIEM
jgi:sorbitol/mannitol transport system substrate-binding protein